MPYLALYLLFFLLSVLSVGRGTRVGLLIPIVVPLIILFVGLRYDSIDYSNYEHMFHYVDDITELKLPNYLPGSGEKPVEALFAVMILIVKWLGGGFYVFVFIVSCVAITVKTVAFRAMSNSVYLSLLLYLSLYLANDMGQIRNGLSSGLVLLSVYFLCQRRWWTYLSLWLSASLIHLSAVIALSLVAVRWFSSSMFMYIALCVAFMVALLGGGGMVVAEMIATALGLGEEFRLVRYMESQYAEKYSVFGGTLLIHTTTAAACLLNKDRLVAVNRYNAVLVPMYIYGTSLMLFFSDYGILLARIKDMFCVPASTIILPSFVYIVKPSQRIWAVLGIFLYATGMFIVFMPEAPYKSILFG